MIILCADCIDILFELLKIDGIMNYAKLWDEYAVVLGVLYCGNAGGDVAYDF